VTQFGSVGELVIWTKEAFKIFGKGRVAAVLDIFRGHPTLPAFSLLWKIKTKEENE
jgi:hypothetical protein